MLQILNAGQHRSAQTPGDAKDLVTILDSSQELLTLGREEKWHFLDVPLFPLEATWVEN